jgi:uncharacterized protein
MLREDGTTVEAIQVDLATFGGNDELYATTQGRPVDALLANPTTGWDAGF